MKSKELIPLPLQNFGTNDPMNAYEYYENFKPTGWSDPERLLLVGVLEIAILDLTSKVARHRKDAIEWVRGSPGRVSFEDCAHGLGFDISALRRKLEAIYSQDQEQEVRHVPNLLPANAGTDDHRDGLGLGVRKVW